jgi:hypothetical protein
MSKVSADRGIPRPANSAASLGWRPNSIASKDPVIMGAIPLSKTVILNTRLLVGMKNA